MHFSRPRRIVGLCLLGLLTGLGLWPHLPLIADDWRQFRGPNASGVAPGNYPLPTEFSQTEKVKWSAKLGDGIASPVIAGGRLVVTAMVGEQKFGVFCFEAATGKPVWKREFDTGKLPPNYSAQQSCHRDTGDRRKSRLRLFQYTGNLSAGDG